MKKIWVLMMFAFLSVSFMGCGDPCKDGVLSKLGDSIATLGKKDLEKERVLAERKANRAAACAEKKGGEMKKGLGF